VTLSTLNHIFHTFGNTNLIFRTTTMLWRGPRDPIGRYISNYSDSLLRHCVTVIATCSPPPRCDLANCRTTLTWTIRFPFDFQPWMSASAMRNQNVYPYWLRLSFLRKRVVVWCHFENAPNFPVHNFFYCSHTDSWLVTNTTILPHPPTFFWVFHSHMCVQIQNLMLCFMDVLSF